MLFLMKNFSAVRAQTLKNSDAIFIPNFFDEDFIRHFFAVRIKMKGVHDLSVIPAPPEDGFADSRAKKAGE